MPKLEPKATIAALALTLLASRGAEAQIASRLEAGTLTTGRDGELPASVLSVSPGIRFALPLASISARGTAWLNGQQWQVADGTVSGSLLTPIVFDRVRGEVIGNVSRALTDRSLQNDQVDGQARVHVLFNKQRGGIWVGGGLARPWRIAVVSSVDVAGGGAWTKLGGATLSGTFTSFAFTKIAPARDSAGGTSCGPRADGIIALATVTPSSFSGVASSTDCRLQSHFSDIEGSVHWEHGWLELTAQSGYRLGDAFDVSPESRRWASTIATLWLTNKLAFVAGGGRLPANPARGLPARNYVNVGMMLAYWPIPRGTVPVAPHTATVRSFDVRPASSARGMQKITVRVGGVESVDVMGDFSDWSVLTLTRRGRDYWELTVPLPRGVHQIMLRVDGGDWYAPPGFPTAADGFGGEVGLVVVP